MIQALSTAFDSKGFEEDVVKLAKSYCHDDVECHEDTMQNLYIKHKQQGNGMKIHFDAHGDEIDFIV